MGWTGITNGVLLRKANAEFQVLLTAVKNLRYQQTLAGLTLSIVVFPSNRLSVVKSPVGRLLAALPLLKPGEILELE